MKTTYAALVGAAAFAALGTAATAQDLRFAHGLPETFGTYKPLADFAERFDAATGMSSKVFAMSLLNLPETAPGIRDGIASGGMVVFPYAPAEFAETNLVADLSMLATSGTEAKFPGAVMIGATMEYVLLNCPDCVAETMEQNQIYVAAAATGPYTLQCTKPIKTLADLKGKKLRSGAANFGRWAEAMGATKVSVNGNEIFDALSQGVVDCSMTSVADLVGNGYIDVVDYVTTGVPGGSFSGLGLNNINLDTWRGMSEEHRAIYLKESARLAADAGLSFYQQTEEAVAAATAKGIEFHEATDDLVQATQEFVTVDTDTIAQIYVDTYGLQDVDTKIARIVELIEKWKGLTNEAVGDADKLTDLYWTEILSKVDAASYGMN